MRESPTALIFMYNPDMTKDTKACSKCGVEKFLDEYHKRSERAIGVHPQCKECRKPYNQVGRISVADDKETYNNLNAKGQGKIDKIATALMFNLKKKIAADPLNSLGLPKTLNMGSDSARHIIFCLIRYMSKQEL